MAKKKEESMLRSIIRWYQETPARYKALCVGVVSLLVAFFLSLVVVQQAGSVGAFFYKKLFDGGDTTALFGFGTLMLIVVFYAFSLLVFLNVERIRLRTFWLGSLLLFFSLSALFASAVEGSGGAVGDYVFVKLFSSIGFFSYAILISVVLVALYLLKLFSPLGIWRWLNAHPNEEEEDDEYDDEDEYDEDEEEYDEEEEEYDEEEELEDEEEDAEDEEEEMEEQPAKKPTVKKYKAPPLSLLSTEKGSARTGNSQEQAQAIVRTLRNFSVDVTIEEVTVGPTFTRYALRPAEGVRLQKITALQQNLELALAAHPIRIEAPIPGESLVGVEVPNVVRATLGLKNSLKTKTFKDMKDPLPIIVGKTITGGIFAKSLAKMPHLLVAGTTGSGKSVTMHNFILSLLFRYGPQDLRLIFIDPKRVELTLYKGIAHLYTNPITNPKKALQALVWVVEEMERRYQALEDEGTRDLVSYNAAAKKKQKEPMPYLVVVVDELADLMQSYPREIEANIIRIAQKSRAVGIHLIISTQRPSVNVITGLVKANIPVRIALQVASGIDSRTILDTTGAENLVGNGDLLYASAENKKPVRIQSAFVSEKEVKDVVSYIIKHNGVPAGLIDIEQAKSVSSGGGGSSDDEDDELYAEAEDIVVTARKASTSLLQRKLKIGYSRAARLIDMLEERGVVGPQIGSKPREILQEKDDTVS